MKKLYILTILLTLLVEGVSAQVPTITSFTPTSGPIGTSVTITGTNFSTTAASNTIFFGATKATVTAATATALTVTVPSGATYTPITVLTNGLIAYSSSPFVVTFGGSGIDANSFAAKEDQTTGTGPQYVSIGDLDGDGKPDLAVTNQSSNTLSVFLNTSTGSGSILYAAKVDLTIGTLPQSVSISDLDGDGKPDLVVANQSSNTVSVFRNTSTGSGSISYDTKVDYTTGTDPHSVSISDLDGDGKADLVVGNFSGNTVSIFINTSTGSGSINFEAKVDHTTGIKPVSVSIGDLDGDGKPDLAVANYENTTVSVFRNASTGLGSVSFDAKVDYTTGTNPVSVSIGDLDGDGKPDLAVTNQSSNTVSVFRNTSTGSGSISYAAKEDQSTGTGPFTVAIGDLDGDSKLDLAVANEGSNTVSVFRNTSTGAGSISYAAKVDQTTGTNPLSVSIGDLDGDGKSDLAVTNNNSNTVSVIRNTITASSETDFTAFNHTNQIGTTTINTADHTIALTVSSETSLTTLIPSFTLSSGASAKVGTTDQVSGTTTNNFSSAVTYIVTAQDGTTTQNWTVTATTKDIEVGIDAQYTFTGDVNDNSGNGNNGTVNGATLTTDRFGNADSAYSFDGTSGYIQAPSNLTSDAAFSIATWVNWDGDKSSFREIVSWFNETATAKVYLGPSITTGELRFGDSWGNTGVILTANEWVHLGATYNGSTASIYINGELAATSEAGKNYNFGVGDLYIGRQGTNNSEYFDGKIDQLRIYSIELTAAKITELYNSERPISSQTDFESFSFSEQTNAATINTTSHTIAVTVVSGTSPTALIPTFTSSIGSSTKISTIAQESGTTANDYTSAVTYSVTAEDGTTTQDWVVTVTVDNTLVAYYPFNGNANDESPNSNNGTVNGASLTTDRFGTANSAYSFDGVDDYLDVAHNSSMTFDNSYTIAFWMKLDNATPADAMSVINKGLAPDLERSSSFIFTINQDLTLSYFWEDASDADNIISTTTSITPLIYYHIALVTDTIAKTYSLYIDGVLFETASFTEVPGVNTDNIHIGAGLTTGDVINRFFNGVIDDLRIYTRSLSTTEISDIYNSEKDKSIDTDFTAFSLTQQTGAATIDAANHTIAIEVAAGSPLTTLAPTFTLSSGASAKVGEVIQISATTSNDYSNSVTYTVTAEDGTTTQDWVVTIKELVSPTKITAFSLSEQTGSSTIIPETFDIGLTHTNTSGFFDLVSSTGGTHYVNRVGLNTALSQSDFNNVEIRFGQGTQKAHRFTIPAGQGAGVAAANYTYNDYVDIPFQVWDIDKNKQMMVSFRDQKADGAFTLIEYNITIGDEANHSREYIYIHNIEYAETANASIAIAGGQSFNYEYFMWPFLKAGGSFDAANLPNSNLAIEIATGTVTSEVATGTDNTMLSPEITLLTGAKVSPNSGVVNDFSLPKIYTVTSQDGNSSEKWLISVSVKPDPNTGITSFTVPEENTIGLGNIDTDNHIVNIVVVYGTDLTALTASFGLSSGATAKIGEIDQVSGTTVNNFSSPLIYTIIGNDGTTTQDWTININVDEGLRVHYDFANNANDNSGDGNNGTVSGAATTTDRFGTPNSAYKFDGTDDHITSTQTFNDNQAVSVSAWVNWSGTGADQTVLSWLDNALTKRIFLGVNGSGQLIFGDGFQTTTALTANKWVLLTGTYDGNQSKLYVNGALVNTSTTDLTYEFSTLTIGRQGNNSSEYWIGKIDEVRVYDRVLAVSEISDLNDFSSLPIAAYNFDNTASDDTNSGHDGTLGDGSTTTTFPTATTDRNGVADKAYSFDGTDYIKVTNNKDDFNIGTTTDLTITGWFNTASTIAGVLFNKSNGATGYKAEIGTTGAISFTIVQTGLTGISLTGIAGNNDGNWHHFAIISNRDSVNQIYIDGVLNNSSSTITNTQNPDTTEDFLIGVDAGVSNAGLNNFFNGQLNDFKIYKSAFTKDQVTKDYQFGLLAENNFTAYSFTQQTKAATIDAAEHTVEIEVAKGTVLTALSTTFTTSTNTSVKVGTTNQVSTSTTNNFTSPVTYAITAENGDIQEWVVTVSVEKIPQILSITPLLGFKNSNITITGEDFGSSTDELTVKVGGLDATIVSKSETEVIATLATGSSHDYVTLNNKTILKSAKSPSKFLPQYNLLNLTATSYNSATTYEAIKGIENIVSADFNNDGKIDIVTANFNEPDGTDISVFQNNGATKIFSDADYFVRTEIVTGTGPFEVVSADLDNDGLEDLIVVVASSGLVKIYRNISTTDIAFSEAYTVSGLNFPRAVAINDLDGNGYNDLVIAEQNSGNISIVRNKTKEIGAIDFDTKFQILISSTSIPLGDIEIQDLNGDLKPEIIVGSGTATSNNISILRNVTIADILTTASFAAKINITTTIAPKFIETADINADGKIDLFVTDGNSSKFAVWSNTTTTGAAFTASNFSSTFSFTTPGVPHQLKLSDMNADGNPDVIIVSNLSETESFVSIYNHSGTFGSSMYSTRIDIVTDNDPHGLAVADFDGSGFPELVFGHKTGNKITILTNGVAKTGSDILTYSLTEQLRTATIDAVNHTIDMAVPGGTSLTALVATFTLSENATTKIGSTNQESVVTANDFTNGAVYTVIAEDGTIQDWTINLTVEIAFDEVLATTFDGVSEGNVSWSDYNNDGDKDVLILGLNNSNAPTSSTYGNNGVSSFTKTLTGIFENLTKSASDWSDVDHDGDLDLMIIGQDINSNAISKLYRNDINGAFTEVQSGVFEGVKSGSVNFVDYNNDGYEDVLIIGSNTNGVIVSQLYKNNSDSFSEDLNGTLTPVIGNSAWADYDNDGDMDVIISGDDGTTKISKLYNNKEGNGFEEVYAGVFNGASNGDLSWNDYDSDGDQDILILGEDNSSIKIAKLYENKGTGGFSEVFAGSFDGLINSSSAWTDYDNDGDIDLMISGSNGTTNISKLYANNGTAGFTEMSSGIFTGLTKGDIAWSDYDNDGDQDVMLIGNTGTTSNSLLYNSKGLVSNLAPTAPKSLSIDRSIAGQTTFSWTASSDDKTPLATLTYDLYLTNTSTNERLVTAAANTTTGYRILSETSDIIINNWALKKELPAGDYTWGVQAIDGIFKGSEFTTATFNIINTETDFASFSFTQESSPAIIDLVNHTISIDIALGTDFTALIATFEVSRNATVSVNSTNQISTVTQNNFTNTVIYSITAEDGTTIQNWTVKLNSSVPESGVVGFFPYNGDGKDQTSNGNDLTIIGSVLASDRFENSDRSYSFDGVDDYMTFSGDLTAVRSVSVWFSPSVEINSTISDRLSLVVNNGSDTNAGGNNFGIFFQNKDDTSPGQLTFANGNTNTIVASGTDSWSANQWQHLVITIDATSGTNMYLNGISIQQNTEVAAIGNINNLTSIGRYGDFTGPRYFNGKVDDIVTYNRAITSSEVKELYNKSGWDINDIKSFSFPEQKSDAVIDMANHTIAIEAKPNTNVTALVASFDLSSGATAKVETVTQASATTANDFTNTVTYKVVAEDGISEQLWTVNVAVSSLNNETKFLAFSLNEQTGNATIGTNTISIEVANGTSLASLISTFTLSQGATAKVGSVDQVSGTTPNSFSTNVTYTVTAEDATTTEDWTVSVTEAPSSAADITAFSFTEQTGGATIGSNTISIEVAAGTNVNSLIATFTLSANATGAMIGSANQVSGSTANDFTSPVLYVVTAEDGTTTKEWTVTVSIANDSTNPVISDISKSNTYQIGSGGSMVSATITDDSNLKSIKIFFKQITASAFTPVTLTSSDNNYSHLLVDADFDALGASFYFEAIDVLDNTQRSDTLLINVEVPAGTGTPVVTKSSSDELDYSILSMPYQTVSVATIFSELLPADKSKWRLIHYTGSALQEYPSFSSFEPGKGYWFLTNTTTSVTLGSGNAVVSNEASPFKMSLSAGWNMIGNPYPFTLDWAEVIAHNKTQGLITTELDNRNGELSVFVNRAYGTSSSLSKYQGAYVNATTAVSSLEIPISAIIGGSGRVSSVGSSNSSSLYNQDENEWLLELNVKNDQMQYNLAAIGMNKNALEAKDYLDWENLPRLNKYLDITFDQKLSGSIVPNNENYQWHFDVNNSFPGKSATLNWDNSTLKDSEYTLVLIDLVSKKRVDFSSTSEYTFTPLSASHAFDLYFGLKSEIDQQIRSNNNDIGKVYPNPFLESIKIPVSISNESSNMKIYMIDLLGRTVMTDEAEFSNSGYYEHILNVGRMGSEVHSGTYILKIELNSNGETKHFNRRIIYKKVN